MKYTITGDNLQMLNVEIGADETLDSVAGAMAYTTGNINITTKAKGGVWGSIKRSLSGASLFMVQYNTSGGNGIVGLAGKAPGKIMDLDLSQGSWIVQQSGFLASDQQCNLELALQKKLGSMLFGGEGLLLQKLSGSGTAFIHGCGDFIIKDLAPGEVLKVSTSNAVAWQEGVKYDISSLGLKTALFGGEGLFVTTLTGPGKVVIQSMTLGDLAMSLYPYMPQPSN